MPLAKVNDIHVQVRTQVFANLWAGVGVCFSYYQAEDAGPAGLGDLFLQNDDFLMVEVIIDQVVKSGPGIHSPNRVFGAIELTLLSKDRLDMVGAQRRLEEAGDWFAQETIDGVRYREFIPTGDGRDRGFQSHAGTVAFEYETLTKEQ